MAVREFHGYMRVRFCYSGWFAIFQKYTVLGKAVLLLNMPVHALTASG